MWHPLCRAGWGRSRVAALGLVLAGVALPAWALDVGSDGSDGVLNLTGSGTTTIDLSLALYATGSDTTGSGNGVYWPDRWAVVFKYSSVNIGSGRTVQFTNHPSGAPVVWLVQGDVTIAGTVKLVGQNYLTGANFAAGGPGGFRGGRGYLGATSPGAAGLGPGGGGYSPGSYGSGGGYADAGAGPQAGIAYGNARVLPLIGGSGGAGHGAYDYSGGGGGGAFLIAANGTITVISGGVMSANGGAGYDASGTGYDSGGGSGGGIRLIANSITGSASGLSATGGAGQAGAVGRIRIEANSINLSGSSVPNFTQMFPLTNDQAEIWPPSAAPTVRVSTLAGVPVPTDPRGRFVPPGDLMLISTEPVEMELVATNVPTDWNVKVRVVRRSGDEYTVPATLVMGDSLSSTWSATLQTLPEADFVAIQARASRP